MTYEEALCALGRQALLCLDAAIAVNTLDALGLDDETLFVCQDAALDDSQKVNPAMECLLKVI